MRAIRNLILGLLGLITSASVSLGAVHSISPSQILAPATVVAPASGTTSLIVNGGGGAAYVARFLAAAGQTSGVQVLAGSSASDVSLTVYDRTGTSLFMLVNGAGIIRAPISPLSATLTQVQTGLAGFRSTDATSTNNTLAADASLTLTFNETGKYAIELFFPFWEASVGTGGFQFDLGSGTGTVGVLVLGVDGFATALVGNAAVTSVSTATSAATIATSSSAPSWFLAKGYMSITVAGTVAVRWAQASTSANATTLMTGAYFKATKIG